MAKEYVYISRKNGKILFRSVEPNYISKDIVDAKVKEKTGTDPRLERHIIECQIRVVDDLPPEPKTGKMDKNKRTKGII